MIETLFGLARLGHVNSKGMPHPLQQGAIFGALAPIACWRGYRPTYPQLSRTVLAPKAEGNHASPSIQASSTSTEQSL